MTATTDRCDPFFHNKPMTQRIEYLDTARFVLVALVVFGHTIELVWPSFQSVRAAYLMTYAFHVPALAFLSGFVSRAHMSRRDPQNLLERIAQPLVIFQILYWVVEIYVLEGQMNWARALTTPYWVLWYLLSLMFWRFLLIPFATIRYALPIAVAIALLSGMVDKIDYMWSLSRTLVFFPFFLAGYAIGQNDHTRLPEVKRSWPYAVAIFGSVGLAAYHLGQVEFSPRLLYHSTGYASFAMDWKIAIVIRAGLLGVSGVLIWAFLALVPRQVKLPAHMGRNTLIPYLVHGLVIKGLLAVGFTQWLHQYNSGAAVLFVGVVAAVSLTTLLAWPPINQTLEAVSMPSSLFKRRSGQAAIHEADKVIEPVC